MRARLRLWFLRACGALLCLLTPRAPAPGAVRRILIIRPDQLGDVLLSLPAIEALTQALPGARLTLAVGPWGRPALGETPPGAILLCPFPGFSRARLGPIQPYLLLLRYGLRLRRQRSHDMAIILRPDHWWGAFLAGLAGIPLRVGYATPESLPFLTTAVPRTPGRHAAVDALDLAGVAAHLAASAPATIGAAVGMIGGTENAAPPDPHPDSSGVVPSIRIHPEANFMPVPHGATAADETTRPQGQHPDLSAVVPSIRIYPEAVFTPATFPLPRLARERDHAAIRDLLRHAGVAGDQKLVVLHPGSNSPLKSWPLERFAAVGQRLANALGARLVVTGAGSEADLAQRLCGLLPAGTLNLAGRLRWTETEALLGHANLVVGVDNGSLHLAVAAGTASVALFGPADPAQFAPWGAPARHHVVTADLPCRPCRRLDFCALEPGAAGPPPCMRAIAVDPVLSAAHAALAGVP